MTDNQYAKISMIANYSSNWWYEVIKKYNMKTLNRNFKNEYDKLRTLSELYKSNKASSAKYEKLKEVMMLDIEKELLLNNSVILETQEHAVGKLKEYMDNLGINAKVPQDITMYITNNDIEIEEGYGFNRVPKVLFEPKTKEKKLLRK